MNPSLSRVRGVFDEVAELSPGERGAALERLCGGDAGLRGEVESLLRSHDAEGLMSAPTIAAAAGPGLEGPGTVIGPYKLLQVIGEGGFGIVYMAEQERPVRRKVALKIIKLGMDTRQVIARFEAERQALAMMDHPNIARVLDAGATEAGRPYFVMELVRGVPITEYCDTNKLEARERLGLFIQVCQAVQHAHQKGIIHRDIKPSNVLVTLHDGRPVPKVIDFGIAKATSQRLTDKTLFTEFRQFIGTPEYMSPEQAEMSGLDVDTRADIYSLGVLLYELLTGTTPFEAHTLRNQALEKIQRILRESEPPLPSTRVGALTAGSARTSAVGGGSGGSTTGDEVARHRRTDAASLGRLLRGDLDWIVMRAIEKDRTRRYETATALAADVVRYLSDEPVEAGPPSSLYRLRKFAKRNRVWILTSSIAAGAFVLAFAGVVYGFVEARAGRAEAVKAQQETEAAREQTQEALELARREASRNAQVSQYLQDAVATGRGGEGSDVGVDDLLARGRALFGGDHAVIANALVAWGSARQSAGDSGSAERAFGEAGDMLGRMAGGGGTRAWAVRVMQARAIASQAGRQGEAEALLRRAVEGLERSGGDGARDLVGALDALVSHLLAHGGTERQAEIEALWERQIGVMETALGRLDRRTVREMGRQGQWLALHGRKEVAIASLERAVARADEAGLEPDPDQFMTMNSLILTEWGVNGNWARAAMWYDRLIAMGMRMGGEYTRSMPSMYLQVGGFHAMAGRADLAVERLERYLELVGDDASVLDGTGIARVEMSMDWLEGVLRENPQIGRRVQLILASSAARARVGLTSPPAVVLLRAGGWLEREGFASDAEPVLARAVSMLRESPDGGDGALAGALAGLGRARVVLGQFESAQAPLREALAIVQAQRGERSSEAVMIQCRLAECLIGLGRLEEARAMVSAAEPDAGAVADVRAEHARVREMLDRAGGR